MADKAAERVQNMNIQDYDSSEFDPLSPQNCNGGGVSFPFSDTVDLDLLSGTNSNVGGDKQQNGHGKSVMFDDGVVGLQEKSDLDQTSRYNPEHFQRHMSEGEILGYQNEYGDSVTHQLEYGLDSDDDDDDNLVNFKEAENRTPYYPPVDHDYLIQTGQPLLDLDNDLPPLPTESEYQDLVSSGDQFEDTFENYPVQDTQKDISSQDKLDNNPYQDTYENKPSQILEDTSENCPDKSLQETFENKPNPILKETSEEKPNQNLEDTFENKSDQTSENLNQNFEDTFEDKPDQDSEENLIQNLEDTFENIPDQSSENPNQKFENIPEQTPESLQCFDNTLGDKPDQISENLKNLEDIFGNKPDQISENLQNLEDTFENKPDQISENLQNLEDTFENRPDKSSENPIQKFEDTFENRPDQLSENPIQNIEDTFEDKLDQLSENPIQNFEDTFEDKLNQLSKNPIQNFEDTIEDKPDHLSENPIQNLEDIFENKPNKSSKNPIQNLEDTIEDKPDKSSEKELEEIFENSSSQSLNDKFENNPDQVPEVIPEKKLDKNLEDTVESKPSESLKDLPENLPDQSSERPELSLEDIVEKQRNKSEVNTDTFENKPSQSVEQNQKPESAMEDNVCLDSGDPQYAQKPLDLEEDNIDPNEWHPQMDEERSRRSLSPERSVSPPRPDYSQSEGAEGVTSPQCDTESYENFDSEDISSFSESQPEPIHYEESAIPYSPEHSDPSLVDKSETESITETESVTSDASGMGKFRSGVPRLKKNKKAKALPPWNDNVVIAPKPRMRPTFIGNKEYLHTASSSPDRPQTAPAHFIAKDASSDSGVEDESTKTAQNGDETESKKKYGTDSKNARYKPSGGQVQIFNQKVDTKHITPRTDTKIPKSALTPRSPVKSPPPPRASTPNTRQVQSKIGSLNNVKHAPGGGNVQILSARPDFSNVKSKVGSKDKIDHKPKGGDRKIETKKLDWKIESKVGSLKNATHSPGGGNVKVPEPWDEEIELNIYAQVNSLDNEECVPGGNKVMIVAEEPHLNAEPKVDTGLSMKNFNEFPFDKHRSNCLTYQTTAVVENHADDSKIVAPGHMGTDMLDGYAQTSDIDKHAIYTQPVKAIIETRGVNTIDRSEEETCDRDMTDEYAQTADIDRHDTYTQFDNTLVETKGVNTMVGCTNDKDSYDRDMKDGYVQTANIEKHDMYTQHDKSPIGSRSVVDTYADGTSSRDMTDGYAQTKEVDKIDNCTQHVKVVIETRGVNTSTEAELSDDLNSKSMADDYAQTVKVDRQDNATSMEALAPPPKPPRCIHNHSEIKCMPKQKEIDHEIIEAEYAIPKLKSDEASKKANKLEPLGHNVKYVDPVGLKRGNSIQTIQEEPQTEIKEYNSRKRDFGLIDTCERNRSFNVKERIKLMNEQELSGNVMINITNDENMTDRYIDRKETFIVVDTSVPTPNEEKENATCTEYSIKKNKGFGNRLRNYFYSKQNLNDKSKEDKLRVNSTGERINNVESNMGKHPANDDTSRERTEVAKYMGYLRPKLLRSKSNKEMKDEQGEKKTSQGKRIGCPTDTGPSNDLENGVNIENIGYVSSKLAKRNKNNLLTGSKHTAKEKGGQQNSRKGFVKRMTEIISNQGFGKSKSVCSIDQTKEGDSSEISKEHKEIDLPTTGRVTGSYNVNAGISTTGTSNQAFDYDEDSDVDTDDEREISYAEIHVNQGAKAKTKNQKQALQTTTFKYKMDKRPTSPYREIKHELVGVNKVQHKTNDTPGKRKPLPPVMTSSMAKDRSHCTVDLKSQYSDFCKEDPLNCTTPSKTFHGYTRSIKQNEKHKMKDLEKSLSDELKAVFADCERKYLRNLEKEEGKLLDSMPCTPRISVQPIRLKEEGVKLISYSSSFSNSAKKKDNSLGRPLRCQSMIVKNPQSKGSSNNNKGTSLSRTPARILTTPDIHKCEKRMLIEGLKAGMEDVLEEMSAKHFNVNLNTVDQANTTDFSEWSAFRSSKNIVPIGTGRKMLDESEFVNAHLGYVPGKRVDTKLYKHTDVKLKRSTVCSDLTVCKDDRTFHSGSTDFLDRLTMNVEEKHSTCDKNKAATPQTEELVNYSVTCSNGHLY